MAFGDSTPGTLNVRVQTPSGPQLFDVTDFGPYPLYSSVILSATQSTEIRYFQYGRGGNVPGGGGTTSATKLDTNMESSNGQLDAAAEMLIYSMRILIPSNITLANMQNLFLFTYNVLYIATQKPSSEGPIDFYPAGGGIDGVTTQNAAEKWTNGQAKSTSSRVFAQPHYLSGLVSFSSAQEFPNGALAQANAYAPKVKFVLDGLRKRNVA